MLYYIHCNSAATNTGVSMQKIQLFILDRDGYVQRTLPSIKMTPWHQVQSFDNMCLEGRWQSYIRVPRHLTAEDVRRAVHDTLGKGCSCNFDCNHSRVYVRTSTLSHRRVQITFTSFSAY